MRTVFSGLAALISASALMVALISAAQAQDLRLLGTFNLSSNLKVDGAPVGGLSALDYDPQRNVFYALSDDRVEFGPARFYTLRLDLGEDGIGGVEILSVTEIKAEGGTSYPLKGLDPEGMRLGRDGETLYWAHERDQQGRPYVGAMGRTTGTQLRSFPLPDYYMPADGRGIRDNLGFESLTLFGDGSIVVANEQAMRQDGAKSTVDAGSLPRVLMIDIEAGQPTAEYVYPTENVAARPIPGEAFVTSGLVELLAARDGTSLFALERSFSVGHGHMIRLFRTSFDGATDVLGRDVIGPDVRAMEKRLLFTMSIGSTFDVVDNVEGITYGPKIDGADTLVLVSDNNFNARQVTQFVLLRGE